MISRARQRQLAGSESQCKRVIDLGHFISITRTGCIRIENWSMGCTELIRLYNIFTAILFLNIQ